ncbi:large-conductance mechanosensitive channel protein MscL [Amaricoccus solimangrovi]|uniref:Large-conductance mechanosensitive channel n=1 Tax=Amaricoccus solimangrovi TaxID=2589815 RepID=A0A501WIM1_9RHOB|nr:large-conductance mechanosensitive channel protein MscL [Amaricoccus solimangrovi]TPE49359.1 large-conductance mechanosensitive channel protein MscL [Amaricoccus solimangrovi]
MLKEFREFIARGNVIDLAVGIIIGAAFTAIVNSLVNDLINPLIGLFVGGINFDSLQLAIGEGDHAATFRYGSFITAIINFLIIAWVVFLLVKAVNRIQTLAVRKGEADPADAPAAPTQEELLTEIRDILQSDVAAIQSKG